jgi:hypothetical protein
MGESCPITDLDSPLRLQQIEAARISGQLTTLIIKIK